MTHKRRGGRLGGAPLQWSTWWHRPPSTSNQQAGGLCVALQAAKSRDVEGSGSRHFSELMAAFHAGAADEFRALEVGVGSGREQGCVGSLISAFYAGAVIKRVL